MKLALRLTKPVFGGQKPVFELAKTVSRVEKSCFKIRNDRFRVRGKLVLRCKHPIQSQKKAANRALFEFS